MAWTILVVLVIFGSLIGLLATRTIFWQEAMFAVGILVLLTLIAVAVGIPPLQYWSVPVAAALPWIVFLCGVLIWAHFVPKNTQDAAVMAGLFPLFGLIGSAALGMLVAFFLPRDMPLLARILAPMGMSVSMVLLIILALLVLILFPQRDGSSSQGQRSPAQRTASAAPFPESPTNSAPPPPTAQT